MHKIKKHLTKRNLLFVAIFAVLGFVALQIPVAQLEGSKASFTIYDMFAPVAGAFIGTVPGIVAVFLMQLINFLVHGAEIVDAGTVIRFAPMLFAAWYFAARGRFNVVVPALAMIAFIAHPIGREVWHYSLLWLVPIAAYFVRDRWLLARAFGATFTAHAVGGALWIWIFALPAPVWKALIPVVISERILFALGIAGSFVLVTNLIAFLERTLHFSLGLRISPRYLLPALRHSHETAR